ncbi:MAG: hypothetical protein IKE16_01705 [Solobacterium sp.]|nr:hypothetical protein [Solobacterium sp.]
MDQTLKAQLEGSAIDAPTFSDPPGWFFVFMENEEMLKELLSLLEAEEEAEAAVFVFARRDDWPSLVDACGALARMKESALRLGRDLCMHARLTMFLKAPSSEAMRTAFGVKEGYECVFACLIKPSEPKERELHWDVFSSIQ